MFYIYHQFEGEPSSYLKCLVVAYIRRGHSSHTAEAQSLGRQGGCITHCEQCTSHPSSKKKKSRFHPKKPFFPLPQLS